MTRDPIDAQLQALFSALIDAAVEKRMAASPAPEPAPARPHPCLDEFIPVQEIFRRKLLSKPTFYDRVKKGQVSIYKSGGKSFVRAADVPSLFRRIEIKKAA